MNAAVAGLIFFGIPGGVVALYALFMVWQDSRVAGKLPGPTGLSPAWP